MSYDIFISYSRLDNTTGRISALITQIKSDYRAFTGGDKLKIFFDTQEIQGMDDWRYRILDGIRRSRLLLVCLSPAYIESEYCAWEFNEYIKQEAAKALLREGVAPIYFVEIPGWENWDFEQHTEDWVAEIRRRQYFDLRPWFNEGVEALHNEIIKTHLDKLNQQIQARLSRVRRTLEAPGNIDRHNEYFVGRIQELRRLRELVALGKVGIITALHGLGGIGKTALAIEYAHAFAHAYPGGCWQVRCERQDDLRVALTSLAGVRGLDFEFTKEEKENLDLGFERILRELQERAHQKDPKCVLVILDNVDQPRLLEPSQTARLPATEWLHIIITTRLGEQELFAKQRDRTFLVVDELSEEEALSLIEEHQPGGHFQDQSERKAALEIVHLLGGFTLAVESAAIFLEEYHEVTCSGFLKRLQKEGLIGLEEASMATNEGMLHGERRLSSTLGPTLDRFNEPENLVLSYSALLPADHVALPWIRTLVSRIFPNLGKDSEPGYPDPWQNLLRRLLSLRLLQGTGEPNETRMHRLVQELVQQRAQVPTVILEQTILEHIIERTKFLVKGWEQYKHRWELSPLAACAWLWLNRFDAIGAYLANQVAVSLDRFGRYAEAKSLYSHALEVNEKAHGPVDPRTLTCKDNLASLLLRQGHYSEAESLFREVLEGRERTLGPMNQDTLATVNRLAELLRGKEDTSQATLLCRRALEGRERVLGQDHPDTLVSFREMALLMESQGKYPEAETLYRRALEGRTQALGSGHPDTLDSMNELAILLEYQGDQAKAETLFREALEICEHVLGPEHQKTYALLSNLANLLRRAGILDEAEAKLRLALAAGKKSGNSDSPLIPHIINNLCTILIIQGKFGEACQQLNSAWQMKSNQHDIISARILINRVIISLLQSQPVSTFVGLLKTLFLGAPLPNFGNFTKFWNVRDLMDHLRDKLPTDINTFLGVLVNTLNENRDFTKLNQFEMWKSQSPIPLDTIWPTLDIASGSVKL